MNMGYARFMKVRGLLNGTDLSGPEDFNSLGSYTRASFSHAPHAGELCHHQSCQHHAGYHPLRQGRPTTTTMVDY